MSPRIPSCQGWDTGQGRLTANCPGLQTNWASLECRPSRQCSSYTAHRGHRHHETRSSGSDFKAGDELATIATPALGLSTTLAGHWSDTGRRQSTPGNQRHHLLSGPFFAANTPLHVPCQHHRPHDWPLHFYPPQKELFGCAHASSLRAIPLALSLCLPLSLSLSLARSAAVAWHGTVHNKQK